MRRFFVKTIVIFSVATAVFSAGITSAVAERMAVVVNRANIRSGPGTNYDILWKVEKYYPVETIGKTGNWYHFRDFEGDKGWIYGKLVKKIECIISTVENGNVRAGPGTNNEVVFTVEPGVPFKVLKRQGNWIHVVHSDGDKGWIHKSLVW